MTTLVTGATGFIGQHLTKKLIEQGEKIRIFVRISSNLTPFAGQPVEIAYGDVTDMSSVKAAMVGCDFLYHLAGEYEWWVPDPSIFYKVNVEGTRNVLAAARETGIEKTVYTGSAMTVQGKEREMANESTPHRGYFLSEYERTKYFGQHEALRFAKEGLPVVCVLPSGVYGPGETKLIGKMIADYLNDNLSAYIEARTNLVYIDDVVEGHIQAMKKGQPGEKYILAGDNVLVSNVVKLVAGIAGKDKMPPRLPDWEAHAAASYYETMARFNHKPPLISRDFVRSMSEPLILDNTRAREELGITFTPLPEGLKKTIAWLQETGKVAGVTLERTGTMAGMSMPRK